MQTSTTDIKIIRNVKPRVQALANKAWDHGNGSGRGFNPDLDDELEGTIEKHTANVLLVQDGDKLLAIAWSHGAWAVDVTGEIDLDA
jgi:hypothetical protein